MKRKILLAIAAMVLALTAVGCTDTEKQVLNVYNWGEYVADGSEGTLDVIQDFTDWYRREYGTEVVVNYSTYPSNEDMYNKISSGAVSYDLIIPSDYMIARMRKENLLLPLDFSRIPNAQYIDEAFHGLYYDPDDQYTIPYTYGVMGIIYDANVVRAEDVGEWDLMWNTGYSNRILQYNNSRDAFGTAMYKLGIDVNTENTADWDWAAQELIAQRPLVKSYVMDEIFNMMESGEAAIGSYYAGDYFTMQEAEAENVDLQFYYPSNTNYFVDAFCIPACAQNKELAEIFINYMLSETAGIENAEYLNYACPNRLVYENERYIEEMGPDKMEILYPETEDFSQLYNKNAYRNLTDESLEYLNTLWETVKISG